MVLNRNYIFNFLFLLVILFPVVFSFIFRITGIPLPTYLFVIIISLIIVSLIFNKFFTFLINWPKFLLFLFFIWVLSSISYSPSLIASKAKFIDLKTFDKSILFYSFIILWFSVVAFIFFRQVEVSGRYTLPGVDNSIWFSRFIGMLILVILCNSKFNINNLFFFLLTIIAGVILLFAGGSRGPFLAVLIVFFIKKSYSFSKKKLLVFLTITILFLSIGYLFIGGYLFETDFYSVYARFELFKLLQNFDFQYLKGSGLGSFSYLILGEDVTYYPHNIFLEILFEFGIIGLFLFCLILFLFFKFFQPDIINLLCLFFLISSLVSGDLPGNNNFFILLYLSLYSNKYFKNNQKLTFSYK